MPSTMNIDRNALAQVSSMVRAVFSESMQAVEDKAKELCPVRTGFLRDSIQTVTRQTDSGVVSQLAATAPYAPPVEFGDAHQVAEPFLRPAMLTFDLDKMAGRLTGNGLKSKAIGMGIAGAAGSIAGGLAGEMFFGSAGASIGARVGKMVGERSYDRIDQAVREVLASKSGK